MNENLIFLGLGMLFGVIAALPAAMIIIGPKRNKP
jgi:hypothetical protein